MEKPTLMSEKQTAEYLQLSIHTLKDWRWKRIGPAFVRLGRKCVRYDEAALIQWLNSQTCQPIS